jgi:hypothetical protein
MSLPIPGQHQQAPDPTEPEDPIGIRPVASVPLPTSTAGAAAGAATPQINAGPTIEDRLTALESEVSALKKNADAPAESLADLTQRLDDAGLLRAHPAKVAASSASASEAEK